MLFPRLWYQSIAFLQTHLVCFVAQRSCLNPELLDQAFTPFLTSHLWSLILAHLRISPLLDHFSPVCRPSPHFSCLHLNLGTCKNGTVRQVYGNPTALARKFRSTNPIDSDSRKDASDDKVMQILEKSKLTFGVHLVFAPFLSLYLSSSWAFARWPGGVFHLLYSSIGILLYPLVLLWLRRFCFVCLHQLRPGYIHQCPDYLGASTKA